MPRSLRVSRRVYNILARTLGNKDFLFKIKFSSFLTTYPSPVHLSTPLVLVTVGTGFLALWVITHLFRQGYRVRTIVRSLSRVLHIKCCLREAGLTADQIASLEIVQADPLANTGWAAAVADATYIQRIASPFPAQAPKNDEELVVPTREGTLRVLRAARDSGTVIRVVVTSSFAAVGYGHAFEYAGADKERGFVEEDWDLNGPKKVPAYQKSKLLAERAAWEFMEGEHEQPFDLATICPVSVFGPALGKEDGTSLRTLVELLSGNAPGIPKLHWPIVDVRDCAKMHLLAMTTPAASRERFISVGEGGLWMEDIAKVLRRRLGEQAKKIPTRVFPNLLVRIIALVWPVVRPVIPELGHEKKVSNAKAKDILGWEWEHSSEEAVVTAAESLLKFGVIEV
jgi:dihydroflavonol-4-reductase